MKKPDQFSARGFEYQSAIDRSEEKRCLLFQYSNLILFRQYRRNESDFFFTFLKVIAEEEVLDQRKDASLRPYAAGDKILRIRFRFFFG